MNSSADGYSGFVVAFEPARSKKIWSLLEQGHGFRDSFSIDDWDLSRKEVFFLTLKKRGKEIDAAVLVQRAHGDGGTGKPKYGFDNQIKIDPPISANDVKDVLQELKSHVSTPTRGLRFDAFLWSGLVKKIKQLRPEIADELDVLLSLVDTEAVLLGGTQKLDRLAEQRDCLGTALDVAGVPRSDILKKLNAERVGEANSVLDLFDMLPVHERHIIEHDKVFLEKIFEGGYRGAAFGEDRVNQVRIYVADKTCLETALGTDLIIYQSLWDSIIFVQYKLMSNKGDYEDGWHYRPDGQFDEQASQIESLMSAYPEIPVESPWDFRLCNSPIYFKFCERRRPTARDDSLVRGMSLSWKILRQFLDMKESRGPKGGRVIGYKNCSRYLNNTEFSTMAKMGWIGSCSKGTAYLSEKIREARTAGREPVVAIVDVPRLSTVELRKITKARRAGGSRDLPKAKGKRASAS